MTEADVLASLTDEEALTLTIWGEARGEPLEGKAAVASVIINRTKHPDRFADTIRDVCLQPRQFSCWAALADPSGAGAANHAKLMAMLERLKAGAFSMDIDGRVLAECHWVAKGYLQGALQSRIGDADHYLTRALWNSAQRPSWANGRPEFVGSQVFMTVV
jgi:hypothetical protein